MVSLYYKNILNIVYVLLKSALFNFESMVVLMVLFICFSTYLYRIMPERVKSFNEGFSGLIKNASIIGERLSPIISLLCIALAFNNFRRN